MIELIEDAAAAWRITHLIIEDSFPPVDRARQKAVTFFGPESSVTYLLGCPYCVGVWVAAGVAVFRAVAPRAWRQTARMLAIAAAVPFIEAADRRAS